jgi:serine/threonine protein kinase/WD40 repeat protein
MKRIELETEDGKLGEVVDDVLSKMARGESVDVEQYAAEHPDVADVLRHAIPALRAVAQSSSAGLGTRVESGGPLSGDGEMPVSNNRSLGDFKIIRELGRGGMGVVYEAEQISLGRKVALKVLPFAGMVRGNALQRFQNEVRAAATLDHPNIVSVYSVGEERGVHYYAMQLVRGQSLAEVILQLATIHHGGRALTAESISEVLSVVEGRAPASATEPTEELPSRSAEQSMKSTRGEGRTIATMRSSGHDRDFYRSIAVLAAQAADALQHAHDSGVIHRDIKPGNLMLDGALQLYVTDFGLARIESDAAMTMTGDLIGTLRYMSPEQALAKRVVIDHRSDTYSLGMTLYELLTLQPAFTASDRQELLKQIAFEDPIKPRQRDRSIPAELETIVLKAIEKNPEDRYATAGEMADDLRAFLEDRPIQAKRPTFTQRTVKWTRRHRTLVNTAAATLAIAFAIGGGLLWGERANTLAALAEATTQQQVAQARTKQARSSQAAAIRQRNVARWNQYCAEIVSGQLDQQKGNVTQLEQKLIRHLPDLDQEDRRGWEWYYLFSLCHPEVRTLQGIGDNPKWSPDGVFLADSGLIYNAETGENVRRLFPSWSKKTRGAWSPDGKNYAWGTTSDDSCIYIWNRESDELEELRWDEESIWCLDWSPDGKYLAAGGMNADLWVWDVAARVPIQKFRAGWGVTNVSWSPDGEMLAAGIKWSQLKVWNPRTGELLTHREELGERGGTYRSRLCWHPEGEQLAVSTPECWLVLRSSDWSVVYQQDRKPGQKRGFSVAWRPDGKRIAYANDGTVTVLDPSDDKVTPVKYENLGPVAHIAWNPDGQQLLTVDERRNKRIKIWELNSPFQPPVISARSPIQSLSWLPESETIVAVDAVEHSTSFWRVSDGQRLKVEPALASEQTTRSPDRRFVSVLSKSVPQEVQILDGRTGSVHSIWKSVDPTDHVNDISWSRDAAQLAIRKNRGARTVVEFWQVDNEKSISIWALNGVGSHADISNQMAWSPDGTRVAVAAMGEEDDNGTTAHQGHVYVVDVSRGITLLKHNLAGWDDGSIVTSLAWSPDNRTFVVGNYDGLLEAVDVESGQTRFSNRISSVPIRDLAWSPDGRRIVSAAEDGAVKVCSAGGGEDLLRFQIGGSAQHASWSPNGKRLAAATGDGEIHVWDATRAFEFSKEGSRRGELALAYYQSPARLDAAEEDARLRKVLELAPDALGYWELRGHASAELGDFEKASQEFSKAVSPGLERSYFAANHYGYSLLASENTEAFRGYCHSLLNAFSNVESPATAGSVAWLCSLRENNLLDTKTLVRLARADFDHNRDYRARHCLGAVLYRDQQYKEAADTLLNVANQFEAMSDPSQSVRYSSSLYFLAMARHRLGHAHQARRILADADRISSEVGANGDWRDGIQLKVLGEEASELVGLSSH